MKTTFLTLTCTLVQLHVAAPLWAGGEWCARRNYVAHEWGTFTSVQGGDGALLTWNPVNVAELPAFVYDGGRPLGSTPQRLVAAKSAVPTLQRLETPVVYFYSDQERAVDVTARFPRGAITEWFPHARPGGGTETDAPDRSTLHWDQVQVLPNRPENQADIRLPADGTGNHYYAARQTDASLLRVASPGGIEHERFLFYRGMGNFKTPLTVRLGHALGEELRLENTGNDPLRHLFACWVRDGVGQFTRLDRLAPGATHVLELSANAAPLPLTELRRRLAAELRQALTAEGLYPREAAAMVQTWDDSWFAEPGLRVLYVLPRAWIDAGVLPLQIQPEPSQLVRVMVGRAEVVTPAVQSTLLEQVRRYSQGTEPAHAEAIQQVRRLAAERFLQPAIGLLNGRLTTPDLQRAAAELMEAASQPQPTGNPLAAR